MSCNTFRRHTLCLIAVTAASLLGSGSASAQGQNQGQNQGQQGGTGNQTQPQVSAPDAQGSPAPAFGELSQQMGTGFIGQGNTQTFVGANQTAQNGTVVQTRNFQQVTRGQNPNQFNQNLPVTTGTGVSAIRYRPPFKLAFDTPRPSARNVNLNLSRKIGNLSTRQPAFAGVSFVVSEQNTVTLTGSVKSEADRQLAQLYVKMEPGVDQVIDELTVESRTLEGSLLELPRE